MQKQFFNQKSGTSSLAQWRLSVELRIAITPNRGQKELGVPME
jgi:hypothetical protein